MTETGGEMLLTIFLKHRQCMNLGEIHRKLDETGFWKKFPPEGTEVVSWYVLMGIGQVVTLKLPAEKLRAVNLAIEQNAWGAFETEFYASYDFQPVWQGLRDRAKSDASKRAGALRPSVMMTARSGGDAISEGLTEARLLEDFVGQTVRRQVDWDREGSFG